MSAAKDEERQRLLRENAALRRENEELKQKIVGLTSLLLAQSGVPCAAPAHPAPIRAPAVPVQPLASQQRLTTLLLPASSGVAATNLGGPRVLVAIKPKPAVRSTNRSDNVSILPKAGGGRVS
jgi:hypothetical protein